ncbi:MAG: M23 family metallopeptidase [Oscillospiraceae bacterium]|nr:M23 family metallopeptidase [Oscillospiraceae bacterium]
MSSKKRNRGGFAEFLAGKGFYIILILCIAAIGVSSYMLFFSDSGKPDDTPEYLSNPINTEDPVLDRVPMPVIPSATPKPNLNDVFSFDDLPVAAITSVPTPPPDAVESAKATKTSLTAAESNAESEQTPTPAPTTPAPKMPGVFVWPVKGASVNAFSSDDLVYNKTMGDWRVHLGLDIESALGTQVLAIADGTIKDIYDDVFLGTTVVIEHAGGLESYYSNLMKKPTVIVSQQISAGQVIGGIGQTSEGERREVNHLHLEMRLDGKPVDPLEYLPKE